MVPAAVVIIGKIRGEVSAASSTALYPQTVPMEERASMLCARVVRGMSSTEKLVTPARAISRTTSAEPKGRKKPIRIWPLRIIAKSACPVTSLDP